MNVGAFIFVSGWVQIAAAFFIVLWQHWQSRQAVVPRQGTAPELLSDSDIAQQAESYEKAAGRLVVLPVYFRVLWLFAFADLYQGIVSLIFPVRLDKPNSVLHSVFYGSAYGCYHFVLEGLVFLFMAQGAGTNTQDRVGKVAAGWALITWGWQFVIWHWAGQVYSFILQLTYELLLGLFYLILWLAPFSVIFRRPGAIRYSRFWTIFRAIMLASAILRHYKYDFGFCLYDVGLVFLFDIMKPYIVFKALLDDSHYWCGLFEDDDDILEVPHRDSVDYDEESGMRPSVGLLGRNVAMSSPAGGDEQAEVKQQQQAGSGRGLNTIGIGRKKKEASIKGSSIRTPLIGTTFKRDAAKHLALGMDRFASSNVRMLNFAYLSLDPKRKVLGVGGSSRVFQATYNGMPVAVKMLVCVELTPREVASFVREANILASLDHPNVVRFEGVCVRPPSVCLVMELCAYGSLFDVLLDTSPTPRIPLTFRNRVLMALQPPLLHLDLKAANFLVAAYSNRRDSKIVLRSRDSRTPPEVIETQGDGARFLVKVSDMELSINHKHSLQQAPTSPRFGSVPGSRSYGSSGQHNAQPASASASPDRSTVSKFTIPETVNWTAPELLKEGASRVSVKADCYALGSVFFEILTGRIPFSEFRPANPKASLEDTRSQLIDAICTRSYRPSTPSDADPRFAQLIYDLWHEDPEQRPSAEAAAETLRRILERPREQEAKKPASPAPAASAQRSQSPAPQSAAADSKDRGAARPASPLVGLGLGVGTDALPSFAGQVPQPTFATAQFAPPALGPGAVAGRSTLTPTVGSAPVLVPGSRDLRGDGRSAFDRDRDRDRDRADSSGDALSGTVLPSSPGSSPNAGLQDLNRLAALRSPPTADVQSPPSE